MIKFVFLIVVGMTFFSGCMSKRGISIKYYNDCKEYYDVQGYYHKKCDDSDMIKYKTIGKYTKDRLNNIINNKPKVIDKGNVW